MILLLYLYILKIYRIHLFSAIRLLRNELGDVWSLFGLLTHFDTESVVVLLFKVDQLAHFTLDAWRRSAVLQLNVLAVCLKQ